MGFLNGGKTALLGHGLETLHTPLFPYTLPQLTARPQRSLSRAQKKAGKYIRAHIRRARSYTVRYIRNQYYPTMAWSDMRMSALRNEDIVLNSLILMFIISFATAVTVFDFALLFLNTAYDISTLTGIDMGILLIIVGGVLASLGVWVASFLMNLMSIALMDGANRKLKCTVRSTSKHALSMTSAVSSAWFMLGLRCAIPVGMTALTGLLYLKYFLDVFTLPLMVWAIAVATMFTWSIVNFLRFSLAPYIVLFERLPIPQAFKKSSHLLYNRGKVFLLSTYLGLVSALAAMYGLAYMIDSLIGYNKYLTFAVMAVAGAVGTNGLLVMLYRKRKLARKY